ncbi:transmembrane protein, putative (macronuclear) [Tetrahymena thermophila SB210]|uniref:Transmembrane protein, putative n=1 Tax=Tetrahymena thermophila (strain SB210) TaxID=312017 RepID=Q232K1_TETTS|nr:transmembrane protein, putative [Tetrahymena thermophila SB210]XP_001011656.1 transmembrane protein, putative [Tetrahymena thermophila SB210]EAR91408.1 transmembrane protein, putative [Tetrahymena thermophila SB210]EAR91411.1 transmembrane protein, putative [Tetrahymena thermophila SB210]|eukprot:XP_001011653.1 transmembrane protein, putative [Tetrahymena thermophila SB210]
MKSTVLLVAILSLLSFATIYSIKSLDRQETEYSDLQLCLKPIDPDIGIDVGTLVLNRCQQNMTFNITLETGTIIKTNCLGYLETQAISQIPSTGVVGFEWRQTAC